MRRSSLGAAVAALLSSRLVRAFIPAVAMNDTSGLIESADTIHMAWLPNGVFSAELSRQLVADPQDNSTAGAPTTVLLESKFAKGVLLHFSEEQVSELPSAVPWVAAINCDTNGTTFSLVDDIFTLARDHGAQAALLYTLTGQVCIINQDYLQNFEKPLDVYATRDRQSARLIEGRFNKTESNGGPTAVYTYNSAGINQSIASIKKLLALPSLSVVGDFEVTSIIAPATTFVSTLSSNTGTDLLATSTSSVDPSLSDSATNPSGGGSTPTSATAGRLGKRAPTSTSGAPSSSATPIAANYLGVVMASTNLTVGASAATPSASASGGGGGGGGGPNTGLAMIILYAITGVVTFMFLIVILSGAIRAIRHPERYGPRATMNRNGAGGRPPQSRAGGLTRAILDTFPVVKFGRSTEDPERDGADVEAAPKEVELDQMSGKDVVRESEMIEGGGIDTKSKEVIEERRKSGESSSAASSSTDPATSSSTDPATDRSQPTHLSVPTVTSIDPPPAAANINPADVDHGTTCPICVCEFEDGEDVRILPCDGRHRFHRDCIDPWLLQVSSLCPLCRLDLSGPKDVESAAPAEEEDAVGEERVISNLRAMLQGHSRNSTASTATGHARDSTVGTAISGNRFSRYVARRRAAVGGRPTTAGSDSEGIPAVAAPPSGS